MSRRTVSTSNRSGVRQPLRGADRNRRGDQATPTTGDVLLPSLDDGLTLLDIDGGRGVSILQSLVIDHLLLHDGPAFWIDANGYATTTTLHRLAPSQRLVDRIHVARGFTPYQHYGAVCGLPTAVNQAIRRGVEESTATPSPGGDDEIDHTPSLIVAPAADAQYRTDDTLRTAHAATLQARTLARLRRYADAYDAPVLLTRSADDEFTNAVVRAADHRLRCERTRMGPRFVGDDFETLVYPVGDGAYYQTTFAYWRQVLEARATQAGLQPTATQTPAQHSGVGTGVTTDGETRSYRTDPLLGVWTAASVGGK